VVNVYKSSNTVQKNNWNELQWSLSEVCKLISEVWGLYFCWRLFVTFWHHLYKIIKQKRKQSRFLKSEKKRKLRLEHCCTVAWRASSATAERLNCYLYIQISALEVFLNDMRYINPRFTYLLTYYHVLRSSYPITVDRIKSHALWVKLTQRGVAKGRTTMDIHSHFWQTVRVRDTYIGLLGFSRSNPTRRLLVSTT